MFVFLKENKIFLMGVLKVAVNSAAALAETNFLCVDGDVNLSSMVFNFVDLLNCMNV